MNKRVKELRKSLGLTLEKFGERLGVGKAAISLVEKGTNNVSEQMFKSICREFNVREEWLRTGEEPIHKESDTFSLDEFLSRHNVVDDLEIEFIKLYFELDENTRKDILNKFKEKFMKKPANEDSNSSTKRITDIPDTAEEFEKQYPVFDINKNSDAEKDVG